MSRIRERVQTIVADQKVTAAEVDELAAELQQVPLKASEEARELLDVWLDPKTAIEPDAAQKLRPLIQARGYPVSYTRPTGHNEVQQAELRAQAITGNVTEADAVFDRLSALLGRSDATATIAVLDSEFELAHPAVAGSLAVNAGEVPGNGIDDDGNGRVDDHQGFDFASGDAAVDEPSLSHGTHVLGIATQGTDRVKAVPVKVWAAAKGGAVFDAQKCADAIDYAASRGARVINLSLMTTEASEVAPLEEAIRRHPEVLFVFAAGNRNVEAGTGSYAAEKYLGARVMPNMVLVTATTRDDRKPDSMHAFGEKFIELAAPGARTSAVPGGGYQRESGSSMAAPYVTSIAGKCLALNPALTPEMLRQILNQTSDVAEEWSGLVAAKGSVSSDRALNVAAGLALVASGSSSEAALDRLALTGVERAHVSRAMAAV